MRAIDNFDSGLAIAPHQAALIDAQTGEQVTYHEVASFTHRFAHAVRERGIGPDDQVVLLSHNSVLMYELILGIFRSDAVWLPVNFRSGGDEVAELLAPYPWRVMFYEPGLEHLVGAVRAATDRDDVEYVRIERDEVEQWIGDQPDTLFDNEHTPDSIYMIQPTGGTTGQPKGVLFSNRNVDYIARTFDYCCPFAATEKTPRPVFLASAPLTHAAGQTMHLIMRQGGLGVVVPAATPGELLGLVGQYGVTHMFLPPTVIYGMIEQSDARAHDYSTLQYLIYGAAPMSPGKLATAIDVFGPVLAQLYGQTETGVPNTFLRPEEHFVDNDPSKGLATERLSSAGRPTPYCRFAILDEDGRPVSQGERGEIAIAGSSVTPGYYRDPAATAAAHHGEWFLTGDIAFEDDEGFIYIVDRKKDMIITGGFNVYSAEVERTLLAFPGVQECSVFGIPDEKWGEAVAAALEPVPGTDLDLGALKQHVRDAIGPVKTPKHFFVYDELPRTPTGKVLKRDLRAKFWNNKDRKVS